MQASLSSRELKHLVVATAALHALTHEFCAQVKPLGVYAMIDDGELDWKIIAISTADPLADKLNDVEDVERCARAAAQCSQAPSRARLHVGCSKLTGSPSSRRRGHLRRTRPEPHLLDLPTVPPS